MAMVRKQVYIEKSQDDKLKRLARRYGVTEAELIRRGIDELSEEASGRSRQADVEEFRRLMEERAAKLPEGGGTTRWRREDLYIR
jgi:hypothetical protein